MTDDIRDLSFNNNFYNDDGSVRGTYQGNVIIDFTTNKILSGNVTATGNSHSYGSNLLSISKAAATNHYTIVVKSPSAAGTTFSGNIEFDGKAATSLKSASLSGRFLVGGSQGSFSGTTMGTSPDQRPASISTDLPPDPNPLYVSFNATPDQFVSGTQPVLTGFVGDAYGVAGVELYDGRRDLGAATVNSNGTWAYSEDLGARDYSHLRAVATSLTGSTASTKAFYEVVTGIEGQPYQALEYDYVKDGSYSYKEYDGDGNPLVTAIRNKDGTHTIQANADGQVLYSAGNDTMTGGGRNETFVFTPGFGRDVVTDFRSSGAGHDTLDLSNTSIHTLAQALHATTTQFGDAVIQVDTDNTIVLAGVTKADLKAHPSDFLLG